MDWSVVVLYSGFVVVGLWLLVRPPVRRGKQMPRGVGWYLLLFGISTLCAPRDLRA
jgi:hypothetical protein